MSHRGGGGQKSAKKVTRIIWMAPKPKSNSFFPGDIALDNYWIIQINVDIIKALQVLLLFFRYFLW